MSDDAGEKFYMHYWHYEEDAIASNTTDAQTELDRSSILARSYHFQPPFSLGPERFAELRSSPLDRRGFECPAGTNACTAIGRSDSCCGTDETCVVVEDTGLGDVGCCPSGQDCSGTIGSCFEGYTSCPSSLGGGCCFPGYECVEEGCAHIVTITITLSSTTLTTTSTETVPATSTTSSTTTTTETTETTASTTSTSTTTSTSSTGDLTPPDRPTSLSTTTSSETETSCPTGFYACAAVYQGGCCQTGRDCDTTSCPVLSSTTIETEGRTIVIAEPTSAANSSEGSGVRTCASGWFSCADTVGGGCCPTGYACGASCTAVPSASTTGTVAKEAPTAESIGGATKSNWVALTCAMVMTWMML
ncbi:putative GPI anchored protein [Aspergillus mulundensis]|uniref:GPI anchored protein n=1 Tax=Aspergillus mulundensis TaxID=1810919 RepID=A0A3D8RQH9_9EURO|nr:hypothetical protein DSM5745_06329 [Aspergillus mulundensis]RDW76337.1 hypothetical protein DSM5745_06329 [Aspergillus mulundensis]